MQSYLNDMFRFVYAENTGAFLSLGSGMNDNLRYWVLAIVPVAVLLYIFFHVLTAKDMHVVQQASFGFILGGGLSNIFDRILEGRVVDFMNMGIGTLRTGIFNVADMSIMLGLFMMVPFLFQKQHPEKAPSATVAEEPAQTEDISSLNDAQEDVVKDLEQPSDRKGEAQE